MNLVNYALGKYLQGFDVIGVSKRVIDNQAILVKQLQILQSTINEIYSGDNQKLQKGGRTPW